jgi:CBS domain-containing protein
MNKISNILSRKGHKAISVSPETSVLDALKVMAENNIGSVVVMQDGKFLGIITERDYSRKVILKGKNSTDTKVIEIMTSEFPPLKPSDTVEHCMELLSQANIRYLPVFDSRS